MRCGILGPLRVSVGSDEVVLARRERVLLAVLLLHANRTVSVERVVDAIWGERPPADSTGQVHSSVYRLRKGLAAAGGSSDVIVTDPAGYRVRVDPQCLDLVQFRGLRDQARAAVASGQPDEAREGYRAALDLWRGRALDGVDSDEIRHAAAGLDEEHLQAAAECIEAELLSGRGREVVAELTELVGQHPHREGLHHSLMLALYRAGRQADALAAYRSARTLLQDELGLEPGPELQRLHQAILNRDPELDLPAGPVRAELGSATRGRSVVPRELPADVAGFTGRGDAQKALHGLLASARDGSPAPVVISAIAGTAGIGKTALAVHWAHQVADRFPDGQLYLDLRGYDVDAPLRPIEALAALLRSLGTPPDQIPTEQAQAAGLYRSQTAGQRVLVVLDNAGSEDQVRPLLPGSGSCLALVTSRDRLAGLVARDGARSLTLDVLMPEEAVALLASMLGADRVNAEPAAAAALAQACAYLPLALRIVAANLAYQPSQEIAAYLAELSGDPLSNLHADGDRESTVRSALDLSYNRLPADAQRLFRLLGLVPGSDWTPAAAAALVDIDLAGTKVLLDRLKSVSLIDEHCLGRYAFHDLLRLYAHERTQREDSKDARQQASCRLVRWYLQSADLAAHILYPQLVRLPLPPGKANEWSVPVEGLDDSVQALEWLDIERKNAVATVRHAVEHGVRPLAWLLVDRLRGFFWSRRHVADWLTVTELALAAAESMSNLQAQAAMRASIGNAYQALGRYSEAADKYVTAADLAGEAGWLEGRGSAIANLGTVRTLKGEHHEALACFHDAVELYTRAGWRRGLALIFGDLGLLFNRMGLLQRSGEYRSRQVATLRELGFDASATMAYALHNLGSLECYKGELSSAVANLDRALALFREGGNRHGEAYALVTLAETRLVQGRIAEAQEMAQSAVALVEKISDPRAEGEAWDVLGNVHCKAGRYRPALASHIPVIGLARRIQAPDLEIRALIGVAAARCWLGQLEEAHGCALDALQLARRLGYRLLEGKALTALAEIHVARYQYTEAAEFARQALENHRFTGYKLGEARALTMLGTALHRTGDPQALKHRTSARKLFVHLGSPVPEEIEQLP